MLGHEDMKLQLVIWVAQATSRQSTVLTGLNDLELLATIVREDVVLVGHLPQVPEGTGTDRIASCIRKGLERLELLLDDKLLSIFEGFEEGSFHLDLFLGMRDATIA
jgi:hypothetical protein